MGCYQNTHEAPEMLVSYENTTTCEPKNSVWDFRRASKLDRDFYYQYENQEFSIGTDRYSWASSNSEDYQVNSPVNDQVHLQGLLQERSKDITNLLSYKMQIHTLEITES